MFQSGISDRRVRPGAMRPAVWSGARRLGLGMAALAILAVTHAARAQTPPTPTSIADESLALLTPAPHSAKNPLTQPGRDYRGLSVADWMFYPSVTAGAIYDNNLVWSSRKPVSAVGFRLNPGLVAVRDTGMHKTTLFGEVDARLFPTVRDGDTVSGRAGLAHTWEIQRDLLFKAELEYDHRTMHVGGVASLPGGDFATLAMPLAYDRFRGAVAVQKSFDSMFLGASAETVKTSYASLQTAKGRSSQEYRDSFASTVAMRAGVWLSPALYAYSETSGNVRDYADASYTSRGYRTVAGLGSDRIGLFRGEVFAGVQQQFFDEPVLKTTTSPVFGGKVFWYPTRDITVKATVDQSFSDARLTSASNPVGFPERVTSAQLSASFQISKDWSASAKGGYARSSYIGTSRRDNTWTAGVMVFHEISRNVGVTLEYDFSRIISNADAASYTRNAVMLGVKYRY